MTLPAKPIFVCPHCRNAKGLWRGVTVPGWQAVNQHLEPTGTRSLTDREVEWHDAEPDGIYGCGECQWEGHKDDLIRLGLDGEPLPRVHPRQMEIGS